MASMMNVHNDYMLRVRQQPKYARVAIGKEKDRKPIDPPPIVQLNVSHIKDPQKSFLQNPYLILTARLVSARDDCHSPTDQNAHQEPKENSLVGTVVSSLYSLKDTDNQQGGFFVFGDLSVRQEGTFRLEFILYELKLADRECWMLSRTISDKFIVYTQKYFPGMAESTFLTRSFSDQGVRLRLRKDSRSVTTRKRNSHAANSMEMARHTQQGQYGVRPGSSNADLSPQNGHNPLSRAGSIHDSGMPTTPITTPIESRGSMGPQGGAFFAEPQQMRADYGPPSGSYGYAGYEDRPAKRSRMDGSSMDPSGHGHHTYEDEYAQYAPAGPRTVPDGTVASPMYPLSTGYPVTSLPAMSGLPMPNSNHQNRHYQPW